MVLFIHAPVGLDFGFVYTVICNDILNSKGRFLPVGYKNDLDTQLIVDFYPV